MTRRLACLDLDGVLADERHRQHHAMRRDWGMYFHPELMGRDGVWRQGRELYENCHLSGFDVVYLTGRREDTREVTTVWLDGSRFDTDLPLLMRPVGDRRPLGELKAAVIADELRRGAYDEIWMFDDDPTVIEKVCRVRGATGRHCTWHVKPNRMVRRAVA